MVTTTPFKRSSAMVLLASILGLSSCSMNRDESNPNNGETTLEHIDESNVLKGIESVQEVRVYRWDPMGGGQVEVDSTTGEVAVVGSKEEWWQQVGRLDENQSKQLAQKISSGLSKGNWSTVSLTWRVEFRLPDSSTITLFPVSQSLVVISGNGVNQSPCSLSREGWAALDSLITSFN